jgi:hypothetical protein
MKQGGSKLFVRRNWLLIRLAAVLVVLSGAVMPIGTLLVTGGNSSWPCAEAQTSSIDNLYTMEPALDLDFGFDTRVRQVTMQNVTDFDSRSEASWRDTNFFRVRHRIWTDLRFRGGFNLYSRFTTEWRKYYDSDVRADALDPYAYNYYSPEKTEIILDNLYLNVDKLPLVPVSMRLGRQDLIRGEGFVLLDGGPMDGSRSIYHDALLFGIDGKNIRMPGYKIDLFAIRNLARDHYVLTNDSERPLREKDETAFGSYLKRDESIFSGSSESYYIFRSETNGNAQSPPDTRTHTIGQRITGTLPYAFDFTAEGAYQFGSLNDYKTREKTADASGYGGYFNLKRSFMTLLRPTLTGGFAILSGDDPETNDYEGWNPVFARWPKWSELYIYSLIPEQGRVAYWTNLSLFHAGIKCQINKDLTLAYTFLSMHAREDAPLSSRADHGCGKHRGNLNIWKFTAKVSDSVSSHFLVEYFSPGNYYADPLDPLSGNPHEKDGAYFIRWELFVKK